MSTPALPSLRRKILNSFLWVVLLYAGLGVVLLISLLIISRTGPTILHVNYDSIADAREMTRAWVALRRPEDAPAKTPAGWKAHFDQALLLEKSELTEPGEPELAAEIRALWEKDKDRVPVLSPAEYGRMEELLDRLVAINEQGMFGLAGSNQDLSRGVLLGSIIYFVLTLILALYLSDSLASRLSRPIKSIAEALNRRPSIDRRLKLEEPTSLELLILTQELKTLWDRVVAAAQVNVRELMEQKQKLEAVLESVEDALLVVVETGIVTHCNQFLLRLLQLDEARVMGQPWVDLPTTGENYLKLRATLGTEMGDGQEIMLELDRQPRHYSARLKRIQGVDGLPSGTLYLLHDISEKRQREKFRAEFVDLLSHELKTPLQSLGTASELLSAQKAMLSPNLQLLVETLDEDVERIRAVVNEFVQITQSQSKVLKLRFERLALNQLLPEWMRPFLIVARDRKVGLRFEQQGSPEILARIDAVKFPWVVSNLLSNAIRLSPPGAEVVVLLTDRNGTVEIQVLDEGPGISEEDQRRMFEPFFQSQLPASAASRGLFGIGLTIAKEVVEAHDGRIEYYPRSPRGSEFRIVLPFPPLDFA